MYSSPLNKVTEVTDNIDVASTVSLHTIIQKPPKIFNTVYVILCPLYDVIAHVDQYLTISCTIP